MTFSIHAHGLDVYENFVKAGAGKWYSMALTENGTLYYWGNDAQYEVNADSPDGTNIAVLGKEGEWTDFSAGMYHFVAVKKDGTMWSAGFNDAGQLGTGHTETRLDLQQIGKGTKWSKVSTNYAHNVALAQDGTLWAWGANWNGQLGNGTTAQSNVPIKIGRDNDWSDVTAGERFTIALKQDGSMYGWGAMFGGRLGVGHTSADLQKTPRKLNDSKWKTVSSGSAQTWAIRSDGTLWLWGFKGFFFENEDDDPYFLVPEQVGKDNDWKMVSAQDGLYGLGIVALKQDGSLWGWGFHAGTEAFEKIGDSKEWMSISHNSYDSGHMLAINHDGSLWGWGINYSGQLTQGKLPEDEWDNSYENIVEIFPSIQLQVNDVHVANQSGARSFVDRGRTLTPLRDALTAMGVTDIHWDGANQTVTATKNDTTLKLKVGESELYVNGELYDRLEVPAVEKNSRIFIPLRAVANAFQYEVTFSKETNTINLTER
ncbi:RCC1 domain-containing protein [Xylanibacillus composti]